MIALINSPFKEPSKRVFPKKCIRAFQYKCFLAVLTLVGVERRGLGDVQFSQAVETIPDCVPVPAAGLAPGQVPVGECTT